MSAIANKTLTRAINATASIASITYNGVITTNYKVEDWVPVGIDANGVAKFRAPITGVQTLADAGVLTHSQTTPYGEVGKTTAKVVLVIPYSVTESGSSVRRTARVNISIDLYNSMSAAQSQDFFDACMSSLLALQSDIVARTPMY